MENLYYNLSNLIRNDTYLLKLYDIKEEAVIGNNIVLLCCSRDCNINVIINKQKINLNDFDLAERILKLSKLIEENVILVENLWIEESKENSN
jgi:leucyl-tRNA synthetase